MRRFTPVIALLAAASSVQAATEPASAPATLAASAAVAPAVQARLPVRLHYHRPRTAVHRTPPIGAVRVAQADADARVQPSGAGYLGAMQVFDWSDGALYQVYAAPGEVTDIVLQPGEVLAGSGPVAAGDTVRWVVGDTASGAGATKAVHILVKPTRADLVTNLVINTDRRTYHLELRATPAAYMASVSWRYPEGSLVAIHQDASSPEAVAIAAPNLDQLDFRYRIKGPRTPWRPVQVFDDGRQTFVEFPTTISQGDLPPLFVIGPDGKSAELVNYRVQGRHLVVDRLIQAAELRLGDGHSAVRVRIEKDR